MRLDREQKDTICAAATGPGGALTVVRASGPDAERIFAATFRARGRGEATPSTVRLGDVFGEDGKLIDEALGTFFKAGKSYTAQPMFELSIHGGAVQKSRVLDALLSAGARLAEPGEFTLRRFWAGRMNLVEAEAVSDLIGAKTKAAADAALRSLRGGLADALLPVQNVIVRAIAEVEARLDFPDEDIGALDADTLRSEVNVARAALARLLAAAPAGRRLFAGARVVLFGPPNAGKSTLMNALLGEERALVHDAPGTTRDVLTETLDIEGVPVTLVDVAGVRHGADVSTVEAMGIERASAEVARADIVLCLCPAPSDPAAVRALLPPTPAAIRTVSSKTDLSVAHERADIAVSARSGAGMGVLLTELGALLNSSAQHGDALLTRARHEEAVRACNDALQTALRALDEAAPDEVVASEFRLAAGHLAALLGHDLDEDILDVIFREFCIGK